ncbi:MAG: glycosyltransferase [Akkermansiaceae bacterium]|nr:glycosyltransferase [Armatimonadota bacterium]
MKISVVIGTRNRGPLIEATLKSILEGKRPPDELIVADQSDADTTRAAVELFTEKYTAVRYIKTDTRGVCIARNIGMAAASGEVIAITDDDVVVCDDWLERIEQEFLSYPDLAMYFGTVIPPSTYDYKTEFIPHTILPTKRPVKWYEGCALMGMGANMALRRSTVESIGGFDPATGPGSSLTGNDEREYAMRALCGLPGSPGLRVHLSDEARVIHHAGARRGDEYHRFVHQMNGTGEGRYWAYVLRRKFRPQYAFKCFQKNVRAIGSFSKDILRGRRPVGAKTYWHYLRGFWGGMFAPSSTLPLASSNSVPYSPRTVGSVMSSSESNEMPVR